MSQPNTPKEPETLDLYSDRKKIYTRAFRGFFRTLRCRAGALLFILFFGTAWLNWDQHQAVWWNLPERKFYIFGATFWPQDFMLLSWLLIICAFGLFFITVFAGRVWCGYACPQSVFTWVFMWVEKITEGDRHQRIRLDAAPLSRNKILRKGAKHSLWLLISLVVAVTFVGYFAPIRSLVPDLLTFNSHGWPLFWVSFLTLGLYGGAGFLREQVCIYMCPYARFQSVMFDKDTLIVSYNPTRGEPRGARKKAIDPKAQGLGDCIDCTLCVQVCPTGIDIRDGLQIDCISCAACVDACDSVMEKMGYPKGLVSYTTEHSLSGEKSHILRPRLIGYAFAMLAMMGLFSYAVMQRPLVKLDVLKDRVLFRENERGEIENVYSLRIMNKAQTDQTFVIEVSGLEGLVYEGRQAIKTKAGEVLTVPVELSLAPERIPSSTNSILFQIRSLEDAQIHNTADSRFIGPSVR